MIGGNMKKAVSTCAVVLLLLMQRGASACPACVGKVTDDSPPFFQDEAYDLSEQIDGVDDIIAELWGGEE